MALTPKQAKFYVYVVAVGGRVAYVGKGCGHRVNTHLNRSHNVQLRQAIRRARAAGVRVSAKIIRRNLTEGQALAVERRLISTRSDLFNILRPRHPAMVAMHEAAYEVGCYPGASEMANWIREQLYKIVDACRDELRAAGYSEDQLAVKYG